MVGWSRDIIWPGGGRALNQARLPGDAPWRTTLYLAKFNTIPEHHPSSRPAMAVVSSAVKSDDEASSDSSKRMTRMTPDSMVYRLGVLRASKIPMGAYFPASAEADHGLVDVTGRLRYGPLGTDDGRSPVTEP
jgi:hypothetical protein